MQKQQRGNTLPIGVKADTKGWMMELIEKGKQAIKYHLMDFKRVIWDNAIEHPRFLGYITGVVVWTVVFQATLSASEHGGLSFFVASFTGNSHVVCFNMPHQSPARHPPSTNPYSYRAGTRANPGLDPRRSCSGNQLLSNQSLRTKCGVKNFKVYCKYIHKKV